MSSYLRRLGMYAFLLASIGTACFFRSKSHSLRRPDIALANIPTRTLVLEDILKKDNKPLISTESEPEEQAEAEPKEEQAVSQDAAEELAGSNRYSIETIERIVSMKNSKDGNLFDNRDAVISFLDAGGTIGELESLRGIVTEDRQRVFDDGYLIYILKREDRLIDAVRLALNEDYDGRLFRNAGQIVKFLQEGGEADYEEKFFSLKDSNGKQIFTEHTLPDYVRAGGTYDEAVELLNAKINGKKVVEDGYDLVFLKKNKLSLSDLRKFFALLDNRDKPIFSCLFDVRSFVDNGGSYSKLMEYLSLKDSEGRAVFDVYFELANIAKDDSEFRKSKALLELGFTHGEDARKYLKLGGTIEFAEKVLKETKPNGNRYRGFDLLLFRYLKISDEEVMDSIKEGRDVLFQDTHKPNTLVVYPLADHNAVFRNEPSLEFLKKIYSTYDMRLVVAPNEQTAYRAIESTPNIELLILCGHGSKDSLVLGRGDKDDETLTLDLSDTEIGRYLSMLNTRAVIFLDSCLNAKGGKGERNLANFTARLSRKRNTIYAARTSFCAPGIHVKNLYPFKVQIISGGDQTYKAR